MKEVSVSFQIVQNIKLDESKKLAPYYSILKNSLKKKCVALHLNWITPKIKSLGFWAKAYL